MADDGTEHPRTYAPLAALAAMLQGRGIRSELGASLEVANSGGAIAQPSDLITCRARAVDGDRLWFFDGEGEPIAPAENVTEAAMHIAAGQLRVSEPPFGLVDALYAAVRHRYPQLGASCEYLPEPSPDGLECGPPEPGNHLRLRRGADTRRVRWDGNVETFVWSFGPDKGERLAADPERAADQVAATFGIGRGRESR